VIICGHEYTLYVDYDRGSFHYLDLLGKVSYMRGRVDRDLLRPCRLALRVQRRVAVGLLVPSLICAGISAAGTFLNGARARSGEDRPVFLEFVRRYMHADFQGALTNPSNRTISTYADWLYAYIRCGLSHAFALEWGHIENSGLGAYLRLSTVGQPQINQDALVEDFARGWERYLDDVAADPTAKIARDFSERFGEIFHD
jgi:hypothetical protein